MPGACSAAPACPTASWRWTRCTSTRWRCSSCLGLWLGTKVYFEVAMLIGLLGFVGTVVLSKFVMRGDIVE